VLVPVYTIDWLPKGDLWFFDAVLNRWFWVFGRQSEQAASGILHMSQQDDRIGDTTRCYAAYERHYMPNCIILLDIGRRLAGATRH
jgi:hypothetical protein